MRIRKRSTSAISISTGHGNGGEEEFLLPLVAAVMDVQRAENENELEGEGDHGNRTTAHGIHPRPAHNWRNALQIQYSGEENFKKQAVEDGDEEKKADSRWKESMRNQLDNMDIGLFTNKGTQGALLSNKDTSSSAEKEITGGRDEEWKLPKSGRFEMGSSWRQRKNLNVHSVKRKRSKIEIGYSNGWKDETKPTKKLRQETYIQEEDGEKMDEKAMLKKRYNNHNNEAEGSQCRRRNGRGWRCSQRTLVGYSLCEHHLGKGRLKSVNSKNNGINRAAMNDKAGTCKLKELRLIDGSRSCYVEVNPDQQKTN